MKVIITGASGMVGEGVLHECLTDSSIDQVLVIGRKPCGTNHPKLKEILHNDFFDISPVADKLKDFDACFFCLGVSSVGMKEEKYHHLTYDLTVSFAEVLKKESPKITFCYISGSGTDSTEKGRSMWARVKGKTENKLLSMFENVYMFRPGYMQPTKGLNNTLGYYKYLSWAYPLLRALFPKFVSTPAELGQSMISVAKKGYDKKILEVGDIRRARFNKEVK